MPERYKPRNRESHSRIFSNKQTRRDSPKKHLNQLPIWVRVRAIARKAMQVYQTNNRMKPSERKRALMSPGAS